MSGRVAMRGPGPEGHPRPSNGRASNPRKRLKLIKEISMISNWDLDRAISYNDHTPDIIDKCFHELVEEQVRIRPDAVALHAWDGKFTYAELDAAASRLAGHLVGSLKVKTGDLVHVCFEKSAWHFVSILAINKAGAAWVPLDPEYPKQRLENIIQQTQSTLALCSVENTKLCSGLIDTALTVSSALDQELTDEENKQGSSLQLPTVSPNLPVYILFTSGSTGTPKGLIMQHRAVCTSQIAISKRLGLDHNVKMLQFAAFVFDLSIGEIIGTLVTGGTLCIPSEEDRMGDLTKYINTTGINWTYLTPSFARTLDPGALSGLDLLLFAGEAVPQDVFAQWFGKVRLVNGWGPAETCCFSTLHEWKTADESPLTVGKPVGGRCWVVTPEEGDSITPIGLVGEVIIQGPTLLQEYLGNTTASKATIMEKPPSWLPNQASAGWTRAYRTGDLCRYNDDGTLEFVNRKDTQIKIRGLRVEVSEVEHRLRTILPELRQVAVDAVRNATDTKLVAYLGFNDRTTKQRGKENLFDYMGEDLQKRLSALKGELHVSLPDYMIPSMFIPCRSMPTITSTKLNRKGLAEAASSLTLEEQASYSLVGGEKRAPETAMEKKLQVLFAETLDIAANSIGRDDSFLQIGGDSIRAIQLTTRARNAGIKLTVKDVFKDPRLLACAACATFTDKHASGPDHVEPFSLIDPKLKDTIIEAVRMQCSLTPGQNIDDAYPLTTLQEGLIALSVKQKGSYINKYLFRIPEHVDKEHFIESWNKTVEACGNLRTRIALSADTPYQALVTNDAKWEDTTNNTLKSLLRSMDDVEMTFGSRLCRYAMVHDEDGETYFVWQIHHAVNDGWALRLVVQTLYSIYWKVDIPKLYPYADFIKHTMETSVEEASSYWKTELEGARRATFPPQSQKQGNFKSMTQKLDIGKIEGTSITQATIVRASWSVVLAKYCETSDVTFGSVVSGRNASVDGLEYMPGPMIATIPVRVRLDQSQSITNFLEGVQQQASQTVDHEQFGLHNIAKLSPDARDACDFSSLLVIQPPAPTSSDDVSTHQILVSGEKENAATYDEMHSYFNYPLVFTARVGEDSVDLLVFYDTATVSEQRITAMCNHFNFVAQQLCAQTDGLLSDVSLLGDWDLDHAMQSSDLQPSRDECVHWEIEKQIKARPTDVAVSAWDGELTYAELGDSASRLAKVLQDLGVGPETLVPFILPKSKFAVIAILGVEMAGGAFVPLDHQAPAERLRGIVQDTKATVVVASPEDESRLSEMDMGVKIIAVGDELLAPLSPVIVSSAVTPDDTSFVIFTSGSTGKPKGVVIEHKAICSTVEAYNAQLMYGPGRRIFQFSSFVFDVSIIDILSVLVAGGTICMPSEHERLNNLAGALKQSDADHIFLTPTVAALIDPKTVPNIKSLGLGGEAVAKSVVDRWRGHAEMTGIYGPAETSITSLRPNLEDAENATNLGRPMRSAFWVVDATNKTKLVPVGCVGEVLVQGPCLARGYLDPEQQAAGNFETDIDWLPAGYPRTGYLSGDLVRRNEDGSFDYIGRKDTQVKLNGQRVELGEIETRLRDVLPGDLEGLVSVFDNENGSQKTVSALLWYSRGQSGKARVVEDVTDEMRTIIQEAHLALERVLPAYMVPSSYLIFDGVPEQTTSGKIDRKTLISLAETVSAKERSRFSPEATEDQAPTTEMEFRLLPLWAEVLGIAIGDIGKFDSFLRLGGDSISAIKLVSLCDKRNIALSVGQIFKDPRLCAVATIAQLTAEDVVAKTELTAFGLLSQQKEEIIEAIFHQCNLGPDQVIEDAYPCTSLQAGLISLTVKQPGSYVARHVFRLNDNVDLDRFKGAWHRTMDSCTNIRTRIVLLGSDTVQTVIKETPRWEETEGFDLARYLQETRNFKMTYGTPLSRYALVQDGGEWYFVWTVHHTTFDGITLSLVMNALSEAYQNGSLNGVNIGSYANFIQYVENMDKKAAEDFWKTQLEGVNPQTFPSNLTRKGKPVGRSLSRAVQLPDRNDSSITTANLIRAAWAMVLAKHSDSDDVCFGMTMSGRTIPVPGAIDIPGPMLATIPVRVRIPKDESVKTFLSQVQAQASQITDYEQLGVQNISRLNGDCKSACDFDSLLAIQPRFHDTSAAAEYDNSEALLQSPGGKVNKALEGFLGNFFNYPLVLQASPGDDAVQLDFNYDGSLVGENQLDAMAHHLETVLRAMITEISTTNLQALPLASQWDAEKSLEYTEEMPEIMEDCAHYRFEQLARVQPNALALDTWDLTLTYKELNEEANRLAAYLIESGVKHRDYVPLCFEKSGWYVVSAMAVLKAGGTFFPMEPKHPRARKEELVSQTKATIMLASKETHLTLQGLTKTTIVVSGDLSKELLSKGYSSASGQVNGSPDDTCYLLFTSGSTGKPKGILLSHRSLCTGQTAVSRRMGLGLGVRLLQFSTFVFDVSMGEILGSLINGACICMPDEETRTTNIAGFINEKKVNWAYMTPTLAQTIQPDDVPNLELLSLGGEPVIKDLIQTWFGKVRLYNAWGPSETCIYSTTYEYKSIDDLPQTIGKAIGSRIWIVDQDDPTKLAPVGTVGEVVLQGPTVMKGYLEDPEKTAEAMVTDLPEWAPKREEKCWDRFFKSGDLCYYDANGNINFVSRKGTQVKIRGLRVELGEIEHNIREAMPTSRQTIVDVVKDDHIPHLVAWICETDDKKSSTGEKNAFKPNNDDFRAKVQKAVQELQERMPDYMVPNFYIPCAWIPYSATDKCNRNELRSLSLDLGVEGRAHYSLGGNDEKAAPETKTEEKLREIWAQILKTSPQAIGIDDNFYHLGGDSIRIMFLTKAVEQRMDVKLPPSMVNNHKGTVRLMAAHIDQVRSGRDLDEDARVNLMSEIQSLTKPLIRKPLKQLLANSTVSRPEEETVFLTGATGYLGSEMLRQLLDAPNVVKVATLVRAGSIEAGIERLEKMGTTLGWWSKNNNTEKIEVWLGDLGQDRLGLAQDQVERLRGHAQESNITSMLHNGAVVNWNANYATLRKPNAEATATLLQAAMESPVNPSFVFISGGAKYDISTDPTLLAEPLSHSTGYVQSKFVAEQIVKDISYKLPVGQNRVSTVKPGRIIGTSEEGVANLDDYLWRVVATSASLGVHPTSENDVWMHVADVGAISSTSLSQMFSSKGVAPFNDMPLGIGVQRFWELVSSQLKKPLLPTSWDEWTEQATAQCSRVGEKHPLLPVQAFLGSMGSPFGDSDMSEEQISELEEAIRVNAKYMVNTGYVDMCSGKREELDNVVKRSATKT